jgi:hypothetical protein
MSILAQVGGRIEAGAVPLRLPPVRAVQPGQAVHRQPGGVEGSHERLDSDVVRPRGELLRAAANFPRRVREPEPGAGRPTEGSRAAAPPGEPHGFEEDAAGPYYKAWALEPGTPGAGTEHRPLQVGPGR